MVASFDREAFNYIVFTALEPLGVTLVHKLKLIRNIGKFDNLVEGAQLPFERITLVYAENGRGKTTLASVLRSLSTGDAAPILERARLGTANPPHAVVEVDQNVDAVFQNGQWSQTEANIRIFDDDFVAKNVCAGIQVNTAHRQNLHELIIGERGVTLSAELQEKVDAIEAHNQTLRNLAAAIPEEVRGLFSVDEFCALSPVDQLDQKLDETSRKLAAARAADKVANASDIPEIELPAFDLSPLDDLLRSTTEALDSKAASHVQGHLQSLGDKGEDWVSEGMDLCAHGEDDGMEQCPFCAQSLTASPVFGLYRLYFEEAYTKLKEETTSAITQVEEVHGGDISAAFERRVAQVLKGCAFWKDFAAVPSVEIDTVRIAQVWRELREKVLELLRRKERAPLEVIEIGEEEWKLAAEFVELSNTVRTLSGQIRACNEGFEIVRAEAREANVAALNEDLQKLNAIQRRFADDVAARCNAYVAESERKKETERARNTIRDRLKTYRERVFPAYRDAVNDYLARFNAGFRIGTVAPVNTRSGSSANFNFLIDDKQVELSADNAPSFKTALSAGDRNTLALAFFFASVEADEAQMPNRIIVIDDPMTSLDEHRSLHTVQELHRLVGRVKRIVVLSHSKPFLLNVWEKCGAHPKVALEVIRQQNASILATWNVNDDLVTNYDRMNAQARSYLDRADPGIRRTVAESLRLMLERFVRVAFPHEFPAGAMLGVFHDKCRQRLDTDNLILGQNDVSELRSILDYANRFHHDTNPTYQTEVINDTELENFVRRTLAFATRPLN